MSRIELYTRNAAGAVGTIVVDVPEPLSLEKLSARRDAEVRKHSKHANVVYSRIVRPGDEANPDQPLTKEQDVHSN
jgi:hypothetical protein